jgi:hypothetical protein
MSQVIDKWFQNKKTQRLDEQKEILNMPNVEYLNRTKSFSPNKTDDSAGNDQSLEKMNTQRRLLKFSGTISGQQYFCLCHQADIKNMAEELKQEKKVVNNGAAARMAGRLVWENLSKEKQEEWEDKARTVRADKEM